MLFTLNYDGCEIVCPYCGQNHSITWDTEYGDPLYGDHTANCLKCDKEIHFTVYTQYSVINKVAKESI